jgi:DMSO/TMAO reductase YedYZ molybdopterin-dependent catalytic subunit
LKAAAVPGKYKPGVIVLISHCFPRYFIPSLALLILLAGCSGRQVVAAGSEKTGPVGRSVGNSGGPPTSLYLQLVDGLHVTGVPVEVDIAAFRLRVGGAVERPLRLSFEQIRALPAVREEITLDCPGFFTDRGVWTGVPVKELLAMAGPRAGAAKVVFTSLSQGYSSTLSLEDIKRDGVLVAYEFDGRLFPSVHGYPLRLAAKDHQGNVWVKWLGEIRVSE